METGGEGKGEITVLYLGREVGCWRGEGGENYVFS